MNAHPVNWLFLDASVHKSADVFNRSTTECTAGVNVAVQPYFESYSGNVPDFAITTVMVTDITKPTKAPDQAIMGMIKLRDMTHTLHAKKACSTHYSGSFKKACSE